jgi:SAM-dependent methyltransferase
MTYITPYIQPYVDFRDTVLDVCCGFCMPTREIQAFKVGVDINPIALETAKQFCVPLLLDAAKINEVFLDNSFDVVLWLDGIEHLILEESVKTLGKLEKIARKRIVVFTPNQLEFTEIEDPLLRHKSFWPKEFWISRGYKVIDRNFRSSYKGTSVDMVLAVLEKNESR